MVPDSSDIAYSVVIPTSNHPVLLQRCLATLTQARPSSRNWEILIIDNSNDRFKADNSQVVSSFQESRFHYHPMPPLGLMAARHRGVEVARGEIISFIDDDSFVADTWLEGIESSFSDPNVVMVGGPNRPEYEIQPPAWLEAFWTTTGEGRWLGQLSLLDFGDEVKEIPATLVFGCNYSIRKDIFLKVGGSHPDYMPAEWQRYQGDGETALSIKVAALGYQARYCPQCAVRHLVPAARMTLDYWGARAFFVGLHSSFTQVRREHGLGPAQGVSLLRQSPYRRLRAWVSKTWLGRVKQRFWPARASLPDNSEVASIRQYLRRRNAEGWAFHQHEVKSDPTLLEYVLRPNYMGPNARFL